MTATEEHERAAYEYGGKCAGEYLESIDKYDLSKLSKEEWAVFCEVLCKNYHKKHAEDYIPF